MPLRRTGSCWKWGRKGKRYCGKGARAKALRQARAIRASGWVENVFCPTGEGGGVDPTCSPQLGSTSKVPFAIATREENTNLRRAWKSRSGSVVSKKVGIVFLSDHRIRATQDSVYDEVVRSKLISDPGDIEFTKYNGLLYIEDGHHQLTKFKKSGSKSIRALINDLDSPVANVASKPTKFRTPGSYDPTRTVTLRRQFEQEFARRFARLKREVMNLIEGEDSFGLTMNVFCPTGEGGGIDPTCSPGGGFYPRRSGAVIKAQTEVLSTGLKDNRERMILIEGDMVVGDTIGSEGSVTPLQDELELLKDPGKKLILIHNHPHGNSFSDGDLKSLSIWPGIESMEVVTHDGSVFFMKRGSKFPSSLSKLSDLWEKSYDYSRYSWNDAKEAGSGEFRHRVLEHIIMTGLSQRGVIEYGAILSPEAEGIIRKFKKSFDLAVKGVKSGTVVRNTVNYDPNQPRELKGSSKGGQWISKSDIESAGKEYGWDVCQIGVCLADRFSRDEEEYQKIWSTAQDLFGVDDMMGDDYSLKPSSRKEYTDRLYGSLSSGRYMDTTVNSFNPNQPREPAGSSKGGQWVGDGFTNKYWALSEFQERWIKENSARVLWVDLSKIYGREGESLSEVPDSSRKIKGIQAVWKEGGKHYLPEVMPTSQEKYKVFDGRHRIVAWERMGESKIPVIAPVERMAVNARWRFLTSVDKLRQFRDWLARQVQYIIFGSTTAQIEESWWRQFVERGYRQGQERTFIDVRKAPATSDPKLLEQYAGGKAEFLRGVFGQPTAIEKVQLLAGRIYSDLRGVTEQMGAAIGRDLADGIARGDHPHTIARRMAKNIDGIGRDRARLIARTEIIRAHAEGQLDAMKRTGVTHVGVAVEWSTADDEHVCPLCRPLDGVVLAVEEAHGLIPRHPNCRCAFVPANVGEDKSGQIRGQRKILRAFSRSVSAERPKRKQRSLREQIRRSRWAGAGRRVKKSRPVSILDK